MDQYSCIEMVRNNNSKISKQAVCSTHTHGPENAPVPVRQKRVPRIHQTKRNRHVTMAFFALLQLLQQLKVSWHNHHFAAGSLLHGHCNYCNWLGLLMLVLLCWVEFWLLFAVLLGHLRDVIGHRCRSRVDLSGGHSNFAHGFEVAAKEHKNKTQQGKTTK